MRKYLFAFFALTVTLCYSLSSNAQGTFTTVFGAGGWGIPNSSGAAVSSPQGSTFNVARDTKGNLYYGDYRFHVISKVDTFGNIHRFMGDPTDSMPSGDGGPATAARFYCIEGLTTDAAGNVYFAEGCTSPTPIRKIDTFGIVNTVYLESGGNVLSLYSDPVGNLVYTVGNQVKTISPTGTVTVVAGTGSAGYSGDGGPATAATLNNPWSANFDATGNIYISDNYNIRMVDATTHIITTVAGNGSSTPSGDGGLALYAGIGDITSLRFDGYGNLHLNSAFSASRVINPAGIITAAPYGDVHDIALDPAGNIYTVYGEKFTPGATAATAAHSLYVNHNCGGPQLTIASTTYDATRRVATFYGDGSSDTVSFAAGSFGTSAYALMAHTYTTAGSYTIKNIIYNGSGRIDSFSTSYMHLPCGVIHLQSYIDANSNCVYDVTGGDRSNYTPITVAVDSNGVTTDTISMTGGMYYTAYGTAGDVYTFRVLAHDAGVVPTCPSSGVISDTFTIYGDNSRTLNIGFNCSSATGMDLYAHTTSGAGRHTENITVIAGNTYCTPASGTVTIRFNPRFSVYTASPTPTSVSGNTATWNLSSLSSVYAPTTINVRLEVGGTWFTPGDTVHTSVIITPTTGDLDTTNNGVVLLDTIRSSYDPNHISVLPEGKILKGTKLHYAVEFENDGNDTAKNVYILDTLSDNVDPSSFEMVSATATMNVSMYTWSGHTICKFDFPNINLLDSSHHGQCTGAFMFNVNSKRTLAAGTTILNRTGIYFDDNPVIMTNEVWDIITAPSASVTSLGTVCAGDVMSFVASSPGIYNTHYIWQVNGASIGVTTDTFRSASLSSGDVVRVLLWDGTGDTLLVASSGVTVSFGTAPSAGSLSGSGSVCVGSTVTLTPSVSGGSWTISSSAATVIGGVVTGVSAGSATVTYTVTNSCGSAYTTYPVTVGSAPAPAAISGSTAVCASATITLTDATAGGSWSTSASGIASVNSSGVVTGVSAGSATISYTVSSTCGSAYVVQSITVNTTPSAGTISGTTAICAGSTSTLTGSVTGGSWSSASAGIASVDASTGVVTGVTPGTAVISYTVTNGCGSAVATTTVTVNTSPTLASISGPTTVCPGATITLTDATTGGSWSSSATSVATVVAGSGVVTGVSSGTATITYSLSAACGTAAAIYSITVLPAPSAGTITGASGVCPATSITLSNAVTGGAWTSSASSLATISSTGVVTGVAPGTVTISYSVTSTCGTAVATYAVTINTLPSAGSIVGASTVCQAATVVMTDTVAGGSWSSSAPSIASVNATTGAVTGVSAGAANIIYAVSNTCGTASAARSITVTPLPNAGTIAGADSLCAGSTVVLTNTVSGGTWSSANPAIASVTTVGVVRGVAGGAATISYTVGGTCGPNSALLPVTVMTGGTCPSAVSNIQTADDGIRIYPNPTDGVFSVVLPATQGDATITVVDVLGKVMQTRTVENKQGSVTNFNMLDIAAGSYLIKVEAGSETYREKIVIW